MDILDREERAAFEAALASSPELAAEVEGHRAVAQALASERSVTPPPALRDSLLQRIAAERGSRAGARALACSRVIAPFTL